MSKINSFDRENLKDLRTKFEQALNGAATELDITVKLGSISYARDGKTCSVKVECATKNADGTVSSKEAEDFKRHAVMFGLKPEWLNQEFDHPYTRGLRYRIVGLNVKGRKNPVIVQDTKPGGKRYVVPEALVIAAMEKKPAAAAA